MRGQHYQPTAGRRGVAAVLAMMYLVLFSTLAIGFYAATTISARVSHNEVTAGRALLAAETGFDFIRHHLANVVISPTATQADLFPALADQLSDAIDHTGNIRWGVIGVEDGEILIPADPDQFIAIDGGTAFRAEIRHEGEKLHVSVVGRDAGAPGAPRGIRMQFALAENASKIFDFGVVSQGSVYANGHVSIQGEHDPAQGSILSTSSLTTGVTLSGTALVSGDISLTNPVGTVSFTGNPSVGGTSDRDEILRDHVHVGVPKPEFPTIDTDPFVAYVSNVYTSGSSNIVNAVIPANTNPTINGNVTISGVLYIQAPNRVRFTGNTVIQGVVVTENNPGGNLNSNSIDFAGSVSSMPVETLPATFGGLRSLTGSFLLAPNFHTSFSSNFGTINGSLIAGKISMSGNAGGTVKGTMINLADTSMNLSGNSEITISSTGTTNYPAGVRFSSHFAPLADTYEEFRP